ncbi:NAD(P)-binding domain-containing protein [Rhizobium sp. S-51]|uniref:NAD(P)-binding domain-containing protein n=1 Tax=Rhizobium terricola TaxID=2728849 RepID=A0A7Y0FY82_9HYPH|nr:pyrroline-5-carboxylate reductase [Rhizobium terricola]NML76680.1 NAD(P)-binding domain-containing protein [Rhizobium terricola]
MTLISDRTIGFVGTGAITQALVRGILRNPALAGSVIVSPRNAETAGALAAEFSDLRVASDNQSVIDGSETVFLAIRPQIAEEVIRPLVFRRGQRVISIIAATERQTLLEWIGTDVQLTQAVPLPFVEDREGVTAIFPPDEFTAALFNSLGTAVQCETLEEYDLLAAASATMATYFGMMDRVIDWLEHKGMPRAGGRQYVSALFASLSQVAVRRDDVPLGHLSKEFATKGGLNEQVWMDFDRNGGTKALLDGLDRVLARIRG